ncbi:ATP-dependent nuclease [Pseudoxanthomonas mexicana]
MKLVSFYVRKFRNIIDSGPINVETDVSCLVGMNEAGKTAVLTALNRLNPTDGDSFSVQQDYPRWLLTRDRRAGIVDTTIPIEATFKITDDDAKIVDGHLGGGVIAVGDTIRAEKSYASSGQPKWWLNVNAAAAVANLIERADVDDELAKTLKTCPDFTDLADKLDELATTGDESDAAESPQNADLEKVRAELVRVGGEGGTVLARSAVASILRPRTPQFFYFSNYSVLEGRIDLSALNLDSDDRAASTSNQTARSLLRLAETTPDGLAGDEYEDRKAELEAVGNDLTQQVFRYWKQNPNLRVRFDVDRVPNTNQGYGQPPIITPYLDIRVEDVRHSFTNNFAQRSSGFRWFFSFLAAFTEFEMRQGQHDYVVLLDEPGLTLHGRAQADLLDFINDRLSPVAQVLYTTHSPFMVETDKIKRIRIVEDGGPEVGATVSSEVLRVGQDSLFPLQAALGYDVVQHLFIGEANLLVEGPSDFIYLDTLSRYLASKKMSHLDDDWRIMPAGGANNIPSFVALIGANMEVSVVIDAGTEGSQRLQRAIDAGRLDARRLIEISEITGSNNSDIEDVFMPDDYLLLYNAAFRRRSTASSIAPGDRIVKRISEKLTDKRYDHYRPAETLLRDQAELLPKLSQETLDRFAVLFERINRSRT